jgi:hypothetical protein
MSNEQNKNESGQLPDGSVPPPVMPTAKKVKPNGEDPAPPEAEAKKANGEGDEAKAHEPPYEDDNDQPIDTKSGSGPHGVSSADLDADEAEFARLRRDLPNVAGAASLGISGIAVVKAPPKNEFFRAWKHFRPIVDLVTDQVRLDQKFYAVDPGMREVLQSIGIAYAPHTLYLIMTTKGAFRVIPVRCPDADGDRNDYASSKELALREAEGAWLRIYTDMENACYRKFPAPLGRFPEPVWPTLSAAKIFKLCFRDRGYLIDTPEHPRFVDWVGRKPQDDGR